MVDEAKPVLAVITRFNGDGYSIYKERKDKDGASFEASVSSREGVMTMLTQLGGEHGWTGEDSVQVVFNRRGDYSIVPLHTFVLCFI